MINFKVIKIIARSHKKQMPKDVVDFMNQERKGIKFDHDNSNEDNNVSRTSISLDENNDTKIRKNNSFLHDNVD